MCVDDSRAPLVHVVFNHQLTRHRLSVYSHPIPLVGSLCIYHYTQRDDEQTNEWRKMFIELANLNAAADAYIAFVRREKERK